MVVLEKPDAGIGEVVGIQKAIRRRFSRRRVEIEQAIIEHGVRTAHGAQIATLDTAAAAVITGNFAIAAGLDLNKALKTEALDENIKNLIAVKTADLDKPFVKDIKAVVESDEFLAVVTDPKRQFSAFQRPDWVVARLSHPAKK